MIAIWLRVLLLWFCVAGAAAQTPLDDVARHVGSGVCADCHAAQTNLWRTSHHARSMQEATSASVLGDFNDVAFTENGAATRFFRRGDAFIIETRGPAGEAREDRVRFTFGVTPLQQYLVEAPGGRLQAFSVAWDARPKEKAASDGSASIPKRRSPGAIRCIGAAAIRIGTSCALIAIRPACARIMI